MDFDRIVICPAKTEDLQAIRAVFADTINTVCTRDYSPERCAAWAAGAQNTNRWKKKLETQYFLVARIEETIVGFASLENNSHIDFLFVHKDFQGKGVAKLLFEPIQQQAISKHAQLLSSDVSITARPFFEKMGFTAIAKQNTKIRGINLTNYRMQKMLT